MPRIDWRLALKALAGFGAGLAIWVFLTPVYDGFLAASAGKVLRTFENPPVTRLYQGQPLFTVIDRSDFDPRSKRPAIQLRDLTFNIVLLTALFAASRRTFSDRNIGGFLLATALLVVSHIGGTVVEVMSFYVAKLGMWSKVHYSDLDRHFWGVANHFYRLVLMYAIAFALWCIYRDPGLPASAPAPAKKKKRR